MKKKDRQKLKKLIVSGAPPDLLVKRVPQKVLREVYQSLSSAQKRQREENVSNIKRALQKIHGNTPINTAS